MNGRTNANAGGTTKFPVALEITSQPTKTSYAAGDTVDLTGLVVQVKYVDDTYATVTDYTVSPSSGSTIYEDTTALTVSWAWTEMGITYTATIPVTVTRKLKSISVTTKPTKTTYNLLTETFSTSGMVVTATYDKTTATVTGYTTSPANGDSFSSTGTVTVTVTYTENGVTKTTTFTVTVNVTAPTWAGGTDAEIVKFVELANDGTINLADYWSVGQVRSVSLSEMSNTYVGESQPAQTVDLVLMDTTCTGFTITDTGKKPSFIVGMKNLLSNYGYMNSTSTNSGGWSSCARRNWCNNVFYYAIPSTLRPIFKKFTWKTGEGGGSSSSDTSKLKTCEDYFALPPEKAVFGSTSYSQPNEASMFTQWTYYQTSSNRIKYNGSSAGNWWECSPWSGDSIGFCRVYSYGDAGTSVATNANGLAPFGCI